MDSEKIKSEWHLFSNSTGQLAGQLTAQLPLPATRLAAFFAAKLVAPVDAVDVSVASERFVDTSTTKLAVEVRCSASAFFLVLAASAVRCSVTSVHFGDASTLAAKKLFVRAKASTGHLILSVGAIRSAIAFPRVGNAATFETGKLIFGASGRKRSTLGFVLAILAVYQGVAHLERYEKIWQDITRCHNDAYVTTRYDMIG